METPLDCDDRPDWPRLSPRLREAVRDAEPLGWAVIDFETTGTIYPHNRVIEIGAVHVDRDGSVGTAWGTLINPQRDVGPTRIHGIYPGDVFGAPTFEEAAADFLEFLDGRLIAGHNVSFDAWFLKQELARLGLDAGEIGWVDTRPIASQLGLGSRIDEIAESLGVDTDELHAAETDALLTAVVLSLGVQAWGADQVLEQAHGWGVIDTMLCQLPSRPCRQVKRGVAAARPASSHVLLDEIGDLPGAPHHKLGAAGAEWLAMLERAVEDRMLDDAELEALRAHALSSWLTKDDVAAVARHFFAVTLRHALADSVISDDERRDLERLAAVLGLDAPALMAAAPHDPAEAGLPELDDGNGSLHPGDRICFTGELAEEHDGYPISRVVATQMAQAQGLVVAANVSRKVDALVCADPETMSGKARKARELGVRIIAEQEFWRLLDQLSS